MICDFILNVQSKQPGQACDVLVSRFEHRWLVASFLPLYTFLILTQHWADLCLRSHADGSFLWYWAGKELQEFMLVAFLSVVPLNFNVVLFWFHGSAWIRFVVDHIYVDHLQETSFFQGFLTGMSLNRNPGELRINQSSSDKKQQPHLRHPHATTPEREHGPHTHKGSCD